MENQNNTNKPEEIGADHLGLFEVIKYDGRYYCVGCLPEWLIDSNFDHTFDTNFPKCATCGKIHDLKNPPPFVFRELDL